jgi:hypothetical protein
MDSASLQEAIEPGLLTLPREPISTIEGLDDTDGGGSPLLEEQLDT